MDKKALCSLCYFKPSSNSSCQYFLLSLHILLLYASQQTSQQNAKAACLANFNFYVILKLGVRIMQPAFQQNINCHTLYLLKHTEKCIINN
jgi:hypothetical protein